MSLAIEIKGISKTFVEHSLRQILLRKQAEKVKALENISLELDKGEICGLLGSNGAGKTTLMKILATLILPDSGSVRICGYDLWRQAYDVRKVIGLVATSERSFYWRLTGRQNLIFFASLYNLPDSYKKNYFEELLDLVGLQEKAETPFMKYSAGQQQRLSIARALLGKPSILLMDEPTKSIDPITSSELRKFIKKKLVEKQGKTILWSTHYLKEAEEMCDTLTIIHKGKVIASGTLPMIQSLLNQDECYLIKTNSLSEDQLKQKGIKYDSIIHNNGYVEIGLREKEENIPALLCHLISNDIKVYVCHQKHIELKDVFDDLIKKNAP